MEINKQLFEDVLSGKLKGVFVLENTRRVSSNELRLSNDINPNYPYCLINVSYTNCGRYNIKYPGTLDIVDFIPETNMKENELTIEIPDGKIVDWEESKKQNKIVLKDKQLTYEDVCKKLFENKKIFYTVSNGDIENLSNTEASSYLLDSNNALSKHQLQCILAKNKLANVAKYLNNGWKPLRKDSIFLLRQTQIVVSLRQTQIGVSTDEVGNGSCASDCGTIWFKSAELAQQAIEILGEETVKLALEPLGI